MPTPSAWFASGTVMTANRLVLLELPHPVREALERDVDRAGHVTQPELVVLAHVQHAHGPALEEGLESGDVDGQGARHQLAQEGERVVSRLASSGAVR